MRWMRTKRRDPVFKTGGVLPWYSNPSLDVNENKIKVRGLRSWELGGTREWEKENG